jgi:hypothetical protein
MIEPGRPLSLGKSEDVEDAAGLLFVLQGCRIMRIRRHAGTTHVARQALWSFWELPRLPRPLIQNKYPPAYPWSGDARAVYEAREVAPSGGRGLVLEHLMPQNLLLDDLIQRSNKLTIHRLVRELSTRLIGTVVTKDEDRMLTAAGLAFVAPPDADPIDLWARYRAAGLNIQGFKPLSQTRIPEG